MKSLVIGVPLLIALASITSGCSDGGGGSGSGGSLGGPGGGQPPGASVPQELVGGWYAGSGHTSAPYNPATGSWGTPSGDGLVYLFEQDGSYTKAFQSYYSNYGCTTGFTAFERGSLSIDGATLTTAPSQGRIEFRDTCVPSANSDELIAELEAEVFAWELRPSEYDPSLTVLFLQRTDGAASTFVPL